MASVRFTEIIKQHEAEILKQWLAEQLGSKTLRKDLLSENDLREQSKSFLTAFTAATQKSDAGNIDGDIWKPVKEILGSVSRSRAKAGFSPSETATFVFSLKQPIFNLVKRELEDDGEAALSAVWEATIILDKLGLYTTEIYQKSREDIIGRQQQEMLELSTPVVSLWDGVLALPMIGTLDSARTQVVMETLLQEILDTGASIAIIDITGVPTVDTLVAQHLLKTIAAARLMGADCIISGIRPQIAQTIVHLGVDLEDVITKATLADAFKIALQRLDVTLTKRAAVHKE